MGLQSPWHTHSKFEDGLQVPGKQCVLAAQKQMAESSGCVAVMCRENCLTFFSRKTVSLWFCFLSTFERMSITKWRPFSASCLYQRKYEKSSVCVSAADDSTVSLSNTHGRKMLHDLLSMALPYTERRTERRRTVRQYSAESLCSQQLEGTV